MELLERESFLQALGEYAGEAARGEGRLVLVSGESGMGKTALLEEFQHHTKGTRWLWGACDGLLTPRPLGPLFDMASQSGGELAGLCRGDAARDRLFTAFLAEIGPPAPFTVAVIEDVHWADEATLDLLSFAGRRLGRTRALLLATYRDDELADDHPLRVVLGDLATQRATRRMRLPPLSEEAVRALAGERGMDAREIYRVTGGNPFYVSEIVAAGGPSVPPSVRDVVAARLARLSPGTRRAVEAAAVTVARVDLSLLSSVLDASSVDECLATGILVDDGGGVRFRHELVRMAVEAGIPPYRQAELHTRLLAALEERGDANPAVLAHHAEGAADEKAVLRYAPEAARRSAALGAHREAAAQYERGLRFANRLDRPGLAALYEGVAGEYALLDRWEDAESALRAALELRRQLGDDLSVGEDLRLLSRTLWRLCRGEEEMRAAEEAVRVLEALPPGRELAWAYAGLGAFCSAAGRIDEGLELLGKARALGELLHLRTRSDHRSLSPSGRPGCVCAGRGRETVRHGVGSDGPRTRGGVPAVSAGGARAGGEHSLLVPARLVPVRVRAGQAREGPPGRRRARRCRGVSRGAAGRGRRAPGTGGQLGGPGGYRGAGTARVRGRAGAHRGRPGTRGGAAGAAQAPAEGDRAR